MMGTALPEEIPSSVRWDIAELHGKLSDSLGPTRLEWVHDGQKVWIVQLHVGSTQTTATALVDGEAERWAVFDVSRGLAELRTFLEDLPNDAGLLLNGKVGLTSHVADLVRKWGRPARMETA